MDHTVLGFIARCCLQAQRPMLVSVMGPSHSTPQSLTVHHVLRRVDDTGWRWSSSFATLWCTFSTSPMIQKRQLYVRANPPRRVLVIYMFQDDSLLTCIFSKISNVNLDGTRSGLIRLYIDFIPFQLLSCPSRFVCLAILKSTCISMRHPV